MALRGTKRASTASAEAPPRKHAAEARSKCPSIIKALQASSLPENAKSMLCEVASSVLRVYADERHPYQVAIVEMLDSTLSEIEQTLKKAVADSQAKEDGLDEEKRARKAAVEAAEADVVAKEADQLQLKEAKQKAAKLLADAVKAVEVAEEPLRESSNKLVAARERKADLDSIRVALAPLKAAIGHASDVAPFTKMLNRLDCDAALVEALSQTLRREVQVRGTFGTVAADLLEEWLCRCTSEVEAILGSIEANAAKLEPDVAAANAAKDAAIAHHQEAIGDLEKANTLVDESKEALKSAKRAVDSYEKDRSKVVDACADFKHKFAAFVDGAFASFKELKSATTPSPQPVAAEAMEAPPAE